MTDQGSPGTARLSAWIWLPRFLAGLQGPAIAVLGAILVGAVPNPSGFRCLSVLPHASHLPCSMLQIGQNR